jgi:hypothetical protein
MESAVTPTNPTSDLASLYSDETSFQTIEQQYQALKTRLNLCSEEGDNATCSKAAQLNASLQVLLGKMEDVLAARGDSEAETQLLRLERKRTHLKDEYDTLTTSLKDASITANMYHARYICYTIGFLFVAGICLRN